jgi:hypothetical protein
MLHYCAFILTKHSTTLVLVQQRNRDRELYACAEREGQYEYVLVMKPDDRYLNFIILHCYVTLLSFRVLTADSVLCYQQHPRYIL